MKKKINILLSFAIVMNLFINPAKAEMVNPEFGETCSYKFNFTKPDVISLFNLEKTGTVTNQSYSLVNEKDQTTALVWKSGGFTHGSTSSLIVNLPDEIDTTSGEIVVDMTVKMGKRQLLGFPILVGETKELNFGFGKFANVDNIRLYSNGSSSDINNSIIKVNEDADKKNDVNISKSYLLKYNNVEADYYDYKFVIDTASQRFRVYCKKSSSSAWGQTYDGINLKQQNLDEYLILDGKIKTGDLPDKLIALKFKIRENCNDSNFDENIKNILTQQGIEPSSATDAQKAAAREVWRNSESIYYFKNISVSKNLPVAKTTNLVFDYTKKSATDDTALMGITTEKGSSWSAVASNTSIAVDDNVNVLEWSNKNFSTRQASALMKIKLPQRVDLNNGPTTIEVTARLDKRQSFGFAKPIGTTSTGS